MKKNIAITGLIMVTMIWGGGFVASGIALRTMTPFQILCIRFLLASVIMAAISRKEVRKVSVKELIAGIKMGIALFAGFSLQIIGLQYTTASKNAFLTATNVVMVPFIAWILIHKRIEKKSIAGAFLALIGVGLLSLNADFSLGKGDVLSLFCAAGFAFQIYLTSKAVLHYKSSNLNMIQMCTAFLLSLVFLFVKNDYNMILTDINWYAILYLGFISTALCYILQTVCQKYVDETKAAIILSLESVFGTIFSIMILKETVTFKMIAGCVIILTAVIIANSAGLDQRLED